MNRNKVAENILKMSFDQVIGKSRKGAITRAVKGGKGVYTANTV